MLIMADMAVEPYRDSRSDNISTGPSLLSDPPEGRVLGTGRYFKVLIEQNTLGEFKTRIVMHPGPPMITTTGGNEGNQDKDCLSDRDDSGCCSADTRDTPPAPSVRPNIGDVRIPSLRLEDCGSDDSIRTQPTLRRQRRVEDAVVDPCIHPCDICGRPFVTREDADLHLRTHKSKRELVKATIFYQECKQCHIIFFSHRVYETHKARHHRKTS